MASGTAIFPSVPVYTGSFAGEYPGSATFPGGSSFAGLPFSPSNNLAKLTFA
jgi:hypothetical protein